jgi:hypothetical protein
MLAKDTCPISLIIIRFHDLHASDIRGAMGEITSYPQERLAFSFLKRD